MAVQLDQVVAGTVPKNCAGGVCGNNGWGNGSDVTATNNGLTPGSDKGLTKLSKENNAPIGVSRGPNNVGPWRFVEGR